MSIFAIVICMFLTAGVSIRFVAELSNYDGTAHSIVKLLVAGCEVVALAYIFTLL